MSTANTLVEEDGFGFFRNSDYRASSSRCYEIVRRYTMTNKGNSSVRIISWGAGIQSVRVPNNKGILGDVVLGYNSMDGYMENGYLNDVVGRVTNRVSAVPEEPEYLPNGAFRGFDNVNWESSIVGQQVVMSNLSNASTGLGWPGHMLTQIKFSWTDENQLHINIRATSTKPMPANITTRCLFNLAGHGTGPNELRNHIVTINASRWTFMDVKDKIPTGDIRDVDSTIFDLRFPTRLSKKRLGLVPGGGYDHNLCIDAPSCWCYRFHARILHPGSGRFMEVYSNQPGLQFCTGNDLPESDHRFYPPDLDDQYCDGSGDRRDEKIRTSKRKQRNCKVTGKDGVSYRRHGGFVLSPQNYPNALNTEGFPSCVLYPGKIYAHDMTYKFGVLRKI